MIKDPISDPNGGGYEGIFLTRLNDQIIGYGNFPDSSMEADIILLTPYLNIQLNYIYIYIRMLSCTPCGAQLVRDNRNAQ